MVTRFSSHPNVSTTLYSIINSTAGKYCSVAFILNGHTLGFHPQTQNLEPPYTAYKWQPAGCHLIVSNKPIYLSIAQ